VRTTAEKETLFVPDAAHSISLGMTMDQVAAILGPAEATGGQPPGGFASYPSKGLTLSFFHQKAATIRALLWGPMRPGGCGMDRFSDFKGATALGIMPAATSADIVSKYGPPDWDEDGIEGRDRIMAYRSSHGNDARVEFWLKGDHVFGFMMGFTHSARPAPKPLVDAKPLTLIAGQGAAELKLGAAPEEAVALLGEPDSADEGSQHFHSHGLLLWYRNGKLREIAAYAVEPAGCPNPTPYHSFAGQLESGLRMGATKGEAAAKYPGVQFSKSSYWFLHSESLLIPNGMRLEFLDGKLTKVNVFAPRNATGR
jgi:hypothetical protein